MDLRTVVPMQPVRSTAGIPETGAARMPPTVGGMDGGPGPAITGVLAAHASWTQQLLPIQKLSIFLLFHCSFVFMHFVQVFILRSFKGCYVAVATSPLTALVYLASDWCTFHFNFMYIVNFVGNIA